MGPNPRERVNLIVSLFLATMMTCPIRSATITVGPSVQHDFQSIGQAIDAATDGTTIIVADGVYSGPGNTNLSFMGKAITLRSAAGPQNCVIDCAGLSHAFHFSSGECSSSVLQGFTIINSPRGPNSALNVWNASPAIVGCIFQNNKANFNGGAINITGGRPAIVDCTFRNNVADQDGGAIACESSNPTITNCIFEDNSAEDDGGAICNRSNSSPILKQCSFKNNSCRDDGAAIAGYYSSDSVILQCTFIANSSDDNGGALASRYNSIPVAQGCLFIANRASSNGGAAYNREDTAIFVNCQFSGNTAQDRGGAVYNKETVQPSMFINCTLYHNSAGLDGGAFYNDDASTNLLNCIVYDNSDRAGNIASSQICSGAVRLEFCCVQSLDPAWTSASNITSDPRFVDADGPDNSPGTQDDDLRLSPLSPCIDAGYTAPLPSFMSADCRGNPRTVVGAIDIGAHESFRSDLSGDRNLDFEDFSLFARSWLKTNCNLCPADLTGDNSVQARDLHSLLSDWLIGVGRQNLEWSSEIVVINEALTHSPAGPYDWLELHNTTDKAVYIGGWFLSDDATYLRKYQIADGTWLDPNGYIVFQENTSFGNPADPGCHMPFAIRAWGETIFLSSGLCGLLTGYGHRQYLAPYQSDSTLGRHYKSDGSFDFVELGQATPGAPNAYPYLGPLVITEIMYNPLSGSSAENYVELYNITDTPVIVTTDQKGLLNLPWDSLYFPNEQDISIPPAGHMLIVANLAAFEQAYGPVPFGVVVADFSGRYLSFIGARIDLKLPTAFGVVTADTVDLGTTSNIQGTCRKAPWPPLETNGYGKSLNRIDSTKYGNDTVNWMAADPTPGLPNLVR
jgi:predicted outer membrane repeat protein